MIYLNKGGYFGKSSQERPFFEEVTLNGNLNDEKGHLKRISGFIQSSHPIS